MTCLSFFRSWASIVPCGKTTACLWNTFAFTKFSEVTEQCWLLFSLILLMFLASLTGNALIALAIWTNPVLHTPMYFFLANLSLLEIDTLALSYPRCCRALRARPEESLGRAVLYRCFSLPYLGSVNAIFWQPWLLIAIQPYAPTSLCNTNESWSVCPFSNGFLGSGLHSKLGPNQLYFSLTSVAPVK